MASAPSSATSRRALVADLLSAVVFPLAITGSTAVVPDVQHELTGPPGLASWVVLAYNGAFAACLLGVGCLADRVNRARFFTLGNLLVASAGFLSAAAPDLTWLVVLRTTAGVGAAICAAGGSSMILAAFPPEERPRVYGYAGAALGTGLALGPVVAQTLLLVGGWRWVFIAPAAIAAVAALSAVRLPDWPHDVRPLDVLGIALFGLTVASACTALGAGGAALDRRLVLALAAVAILSSGLLVRVEFRSPAPAIPFDLIRIPDYRWYAASSGAIMGILVCALTFLPQISSILRLPRALETVALTLLTAPPVLFPLFCADFTRRWPRLTVQVALTASALACLLLSLADSATGVLCASAVFGVCLGVTQGVPDGNALKHVPATRGGAGAALFSTSRMTIETLVLAASTGFATAAGPQRGPLVSGLVCLLIVAMGI